LVATAKSACGYFSGETPEKRPRPVGKVWKFPQRTKFQVLDPREEAPANKPDWLPAPSVVIDLANGEGFRAFGMDIFAGLQLANASSKNTGLGRTPKRPPVL